MSTANICVRSGRQSISLESVFRIYLFSYYTHAVASALNYFIRDMTFYEAQHSAAIGLGRDLKLKLLHIVFMCDKRISIVNDTNRFRPSQQIRFWFCFDESVGRFGECARICRYLRSTHSHTKKVADFISWANWKWDECGRKTFFPFWDCRVGIIKSCVCTCIERKFANLRSQHSNEFWSTFRSVVIGQSPRKLHLLLRMNDSLHFEIPFSNGI